MKVLVGNIDNEKITCVVDDNIVMYIPKNELGFKVHTGETIEIIIDNDLYVTFKKDNIETKTKNSEITNIINNFYK